MTGVTKMIRNVGLRFAVSALAIGTTMVACKPATSAFGISSASAHAPKGEQQAAAFYAKARAAVQKGDKKSALGFAEQAVEASPRDVGYRMLLGDLYLGNGRFQSAETTFGDVLSLDPDNSRASLSLALAQIALGRNAAAIGRLERMTATASPDDIGLAFALAGQPQRAIDLLEPAARVPGATGRVRQNLALAYALAGDWEKARITAAQDVSPDQLGARLEQWASFANPRSSSDQVAGLLNVTPVEDPGQPARLALAPTQPADNAYAAAEAAPEPAPAPVEMAAVEDVAPAPAPVEVASSEPADWVSSVEQLREDPGRSDRSRPQEVTRPVYAEAVESLVRPAPSVLRASSKIQVQEPAFERAPRAARARSGNAVSGPGRFVVQLGAFSSPKNVERGWAQAYKRYGFDNHTPLSTTVSLPGRGTLHRLSVAGFQTHDDASRVCQSVRAKGGSCFVRAVAGDSPVQWAWRYNGGRRG